jgi:3-deoxy-D-manno-octulosonate 8-phosphate phosphatase (KDO 8-P phosphatase)
MDDLKPFLDLGTTLVRPPAELQQRVQRIRAVLFDWDGVFNDGWKDADGGSPFSEVGSMGVNMLRFGLWMEQEERLPFAGVITGQHNKHAERFAQREKLHGLYMGFIHKPQAFDAFLAKHGLKEEEVAFFFDDAIDLSVADRCGLRILMRHRAGALFAQHAIARGCVDIATALSGGEQGLREATDVVLALLQRFHTVIEHRAVYSETYQRYLAARNATVPEVVIGIR